MVGLQDQIKQLRRELHAEDVLADLQEQQRTGEYKLPESRKAPYTSPALERTQIEIHRLRHAQRQAVESQKQSTFGKVVGEVLEIPRTAQTTADLSYNLRQNIVAAFSHPITTGKAAGQALRGTFSRYTAEQLQNSLRESPNYLNYNRMGIAIHELESHVPGLREEGFHGSLLERIPILGEVVKGANRNMTLTGNLTRAAWPTISWRRTPTQPWRR